MTENKIKLEIDDVIENVEKKLLRMMDRCKQELLEIRYEVITTLDTLMDCCEFKDTKDPKSSQGRIEYAYIKVFKKDTPTLISKSQALVDLPDGYSLNSANLLNQCSDYYEWRISRVYLSSAVVSPWSQPKLI